jgi:hypothetical protein
MGVANARSTGRILRRVFMGTAVGQEESSHIIS